MVEVKIFNDGELVTESKGKVVFFALAVADNLVAAAGNMEDAIVDAAGFVKRMIDRFPKAIIEKYIKY